MLHTCGRWTLNFLMITLCMRPLKELTHSVFWLRFRRMFGLFAFFYVLLHLSVYLLLDQAATSARCGRISSSARTSPSACWDCCC